VWSLRAAGIFLAVLGAASAAEPTLTHLYPAAGQQGTTVSVTAVGKSEPWSPQVWVDAPGITFTAAKTKGKFDVEISKDAAPGPHLVRFYNQDGASVPRFFIVSTEPELLEKEPNDDYHSPQKIDALPATISGKLDKSGDVDSFGVMLKKGETLTAWVEAYVLASTFDGMLRVVDESGNELAFNHDGRTLDPYLTWKAPRDGTFIVQLMGFAYPATADVRLTGSDGCVYRLHLTTSPQPLISFPSRDANQGAQIAEQEPNDTIDKAQSVPLPCSISGCIDKSGDEDRYAFAAEKGRIYDLNLIAARAGSPLDARLKIENQDGKQLVRNDDADGSRDPHIVWTAPSSGTFYAAAGDLTHHGGPGFLYQLDIGEAVPTVTGTLSNHAFAIAPGKTSEIKATVKASNGFKSKLRLAAKNLPEGLSAPDVDVPEKGGEVTLKLNADANAMAASQPIQLVLREVESGAEHPVIYTMTTTGENNGVPQGYTELVINSTDQLWLTVTAPAQKTETPKPDAASASLADDQPLFVATPFTGAGAFTPDIEGPACDASGNVYFVNGPWVQTIVKVTPQGVSEVFATLPGDSIGNGIRFGRDGAMYVADYTAHNVLQIDMKTRAVKVFAHEDLMNQPNDLAIAPDGTLYASDPNWDNGDGQLWSIDRQGHVRRLAENVGTTNGIEVSPDGHTLYVNESIQRNVWAFTIAPDGSLTNKRLLKKFDDFSLDGMRCDVDGNLYVTRQSKGTVVKLSPTGEVLREFDILGAKPSNLCFGGPDGRTLYITEVEHQRLVQVRVDRPGLEWERWRRK
jgi:sugar lactone lactonase YvrE